MWKKNTSPKQNQTQSILDIERELEKLICLNTDYDSLK